MTSRREDELPDDYEIIELDDEELDEDEDDDDLSDPSHPDHDLSEWSSYSPGVPDSKPWFIRRWAVIIVSALVILSLVLPFLPRL